MTGKTHSPAGIVLTLRHQMIAVAYFAVLFAGLVRVLEGPAASAGSAAARWALLGSPWVLGGLVWVFDRPGPLRDWTTAGLLFAFYPALTIYVDVSVALGAAESGALPGLGSMALFNALMLGSSLAYYLRMRRLHCPACGERSMIPLVRLKGQSGRSNRTRWCASCGVQFWRDPSGAWRPERRTTWAGASGPLGLPSGEPSDVSRAAG
jgi:hypothetical protein